MLKITTVVYLCFVLARVTQHQPTYLSESGCLNSRINTAELATIYHLRKLEAKLLSAMTCETRNKLKFKYIIHVDNKSWFAAQSYCQKYYGGDLVSVTSQDKWRDIVGTILSWTPNHGCTDGFWISGYKLDNGTWIIRDGVSVVSSLWLDGQPDNAGGNQGCLGLFSDQHNFKQDDNDCIKKHCYICEV